MKAHSSPRREHNQRIVADGGDGSCVQLDARSRFGVRSSQSEHLQRSARSNTITQVGIGSSDHGME